jgi:ribosomal protein L16/L10AE
MFCEMRNSHGITSRKLKAADQTIRRHISPAERLEILDEAYRIREEEQRYQDGLSGIIPSDRIWK